MTEATKKLSRADFVRAYAERSGLTADYAVLGILDVVPLVTLVALPCGCEEDDCEGWAMVGASSVNSHLELYAPEPIRSVMRALVLQERLK